MKDAQRDMKPAWMTKGVGIGTQIFGEATGELMKPGMTKADLEALEKRGPQQGPDPFGEIFAEHQGNKSTEKPASTEGGDLPHPRRAPLPDQGAIFTSRGTSEPQPQGNSGDSGRGPSPTNPARSRAPLPPQDQIFSSAKGLSSSTPAPAPSKAPAPASASLPWTPPQNPPPGIGGCCAPQYPGFAQGCSGPAPSGLWTAPPGPMPGAGCGAMPFGGFPPGSATAPGGWTPHPGPPPGIGCNAPPFGSYGMQMPPPQQVPPPGPMSYPPQVPQSAAPPMGMPPQFPQQMGPPPGYVGPFGGPPATWNGPPPQAFMY